MGQCADPASLPPAAPASPAGDALPHGCRLQQGAPGFRCPTRLKTAAVPVAW